MMEILSMDQVSRYQHSPGLTYVATDAVSTTSQPWLPLSATCGMSTFHIWLTKRHSFRCSRTPSADQVMRSSSLRWDV